MRPSPSWYGADRDVASDRPSAQEPSVGVAGGSKDLSVTEIPALGQRHSLPNDFVKLH